MFDEEYDFAGMDDEPEEWEETEEDWYDRDCDYEVGFDPYLGCYTDDC